MKTRELLAKNQQADFLAPFLVRFEDKKPQKEEVDVAIQDCLKDFKKNYADMENELQRRYDETTAELNSLKRFLHRYMDQFSVQEYEKFILEGWVGLWAASRFEDNGERPFTFMSQMGFPKKTFLKENF